jgi:ribose transport system permease protein
VEFTPVGAAIAGVAVGVALGACNGLVITRLAVPPFVATLGMLSVARGLTMLWTGGYPITGLGAEFGFIGTGRVWGLPMPALLAGALALAFFGVTRRTRFGRYLYAIGGNERAAALSGLNVRRVKLLVYTLGGALAGVAGLLATARLDSATPNAGFGYELDSIAAVVIGGTSLSGGRGWILGTVLGCLTIGVLNNGLILLEISPFWREVVKGVVIVAAVAIDNLSRRER